MNRNRENEEEKEDEDDWVRFVSCNPETKWRIKWKNKWGKMVHGKPPSLGRTHWDHEPNDVVLRLQNTILRYGRLQICATRGRFMGS